MADLEKLVLTIEARTAQFEKALKKIEGNTSSFAVKGSRNMRKFGRQVDNLEKKMGRFAARSGGLLKGAVFAKLSQEIGSSLNGLYDDLDSIGKIADKVGLTTDELQELRFAAQLSGVSVGGLDVAMQRFARRTAEASDGTGVLYKVLKANNISVRDSTGAMRPLIDIIKDYADLIQAAPSQQEKLRLSFVAFDTEGAALVNTLRNGAAGLDAMRVEAKELGVVIGEDLVRDAARVNDEFTKMAKSIATSFKSAVVSVGRETGFLLDLLNKIEDRDLSTIEGQISQKTQKISKFSTSSLYAAISGGEAGLAKAKKELAELQDIRDKIIKARSPIITAPTGDFNGFGATQPGGSGSSGKGRSAAARAAEVEAQRILDVVRSLEFEAEQLGRTKDQQELYNALSRAGVAVESEQGKAIQAAVIALQAKQAAVDAITAREKTLTQQTELLADGLGRFAEAGYDAFEDIIFGAGDAEDAIKRLILQLSAAELRSAFLGGGGTSGGGLAGLLISAFTGGSSGADPWDGLRANGGLVRPGQSYLVGEKRAERFTPTVAGRIDPMRPFSSNESSGGSSGPVVYMTVQTKDAESFKQSKQQIATDLARAIGRGQRNM